MNDIKGFGIALQNARLRARMTQEDLAGLLKVRALTVSRWERGIAFPQKRHMLMIGELFSDLAAWMF